LITYKRKKKKEAWGFLFWKRGRKGGSVFLFLERAATMLIEKEENQEKSRIP
jgi:hypothetical protein